MPSAWSGLLHERGSTGAVTSPTDHAVVPSASQRDDRAVVVALHEAGADDLGDDHGCWHAQRLGRGSQFVVDADAERMQPVPTPPVPQHCPTPVELDDLELLTSGALGEPAAFNQPGSPVTLTLPEPVAAQARSVGAVELVDPEGLPLARVSWPGGVVDPLTHAAVRPVPRPDAHARDVPRAVRRPHRRPGQRPAHHRPGRGAGRARPASPCSP